MTTDIENVTLLDTAVTALKKYYKAGESEDMSFVMGAHKTGNDAIDAFTVKLQEKGLWEEMVVSALPTEHVRKLNSLLLDNTEGAYFVRDLVTSDETLPKLESFVSAINEIDVPSYIDAIESKDIIQIVYEAGLADSVEFYDKINSVSSFINQVPPEVAGETSSVLLDNTYFSVNAEESHRINSPGLAAFVLPNNKFSIATRNTDAVALFLNAIPTIEMSRCTPFIDIKFISSVDPTIEQERKEMSILNFLRSNNEDDDGIRLGEIGTVYSEYADETINTTDEQFVNISAAGMELFTSPQTMINPTGGGFDKMAPFMTMDQLTIDVAGLGQALLSNKVGQLTFTLHDRSRLAEIAPLVAPERFGSTYLAIEYGWSHPQGADPDVNPFGYLVNSMRSRGNFTVAATNFTIGDDGQVKLTMRLVSRPVQDVRMFPVTCGTYVPIAPIRSLIDSLVAKQASWNANVGWRNDLYESLGMSKVYPEIDLLTEDPIAAGSMIPRGVFKSVLAAMDKSGGLTADEFIGELAGLNKETLIGANDASLVKEVLNKQMRLLKKVDNPLASSDPSVVDPFFPQAFHSTQTSSFEFKYEDASPKIAPSTETEGWSTPADPGTFVSLGKIFMEFVGGPLAASGKYDEVQMFFYRFNAKSGAARLYDSIASFVVNAAEFEVRLLMTLMNGNTSLSVNRFVELFNSKFISRVDDPNYGISQIRGAIDTATSDATEDAATAEDIKILNERVAEAMKVIYMEGGGEPSFVPPRLSMYLEDVPRIVPANEGSETEPPVPRHVDRSQTVLRVHIYDAKATPYDDEEFILRAGGSGNISVRVTGESPIARPFRPMGINHVFSAVVDNELLVKTGASEEGDLETYTSAVSNDVLKGFIKQTVPSLTLGYAFSGIKTFNMSANTQGTIQDTLMLNAMDEDHTVGDTTGNKRTSGIDPITVIPASVTMTTLGCPLIEYGSTFFVDPGTGTTADNFYIINKISHTLSAGRFDTSLGLGFASSGTIKNLRARLAANEVPEEG